MARFFSISEAPGYLLASRLYERKPVTDLWSRLSAVAKQQWKWKNVTNKKDPVLLSSKRRFLQVHGPPGSGKSSATFRWLWSVCEINKANATPVQAVWVNCAADKEQSDEVCWIIRKNAGVERVEMVPMQPPQKVADADFADIVVFDGIRASSVEQWRSLMNGLARRGVAVVIISSEGVRFHEGDSQDILKLEHFVPSWVKEEYLEACRDDQFWTDCHHYFVNANENDNFDRRTHLLNEKYEIAGHSARFMFSNFTDLLKASIKKLALALGGIESLEAAVNSDRSTGAVNSLVARLQANKNGTTPHYRAVFPVAEDFTLVGTTFADFMPLDAEVDDEQSTPRLVSTFASKEVVERIPSSIERLRNMALALSNKVIEGYALEEQLKKNLKEASNPGLHLTVEIGGANVALPVGNLIFCDASEVQSHLERRLDPETWIYVAGRQGAFDAIHVVSDTHLRFVQVTAGKSHTFYLDVIDVLLQQLATSGITLTHVEFMILRPSTDRHRDFQLGTARGRIQNYLRFDGQPWHRPDYRDNVNFAFLEWTY